MIEKTLSPWSIARDFFKHFPRREDLFEHVFVDVATKPGGWAGTFDRHLWKTFSVSVDPYYFTPEVTSARRANEQFAILDAGNSPEAHEGYLRVGSSVATMTAQADSITTVSSLRELLDDRVRDIDLLRSDCRGRDFPILSALNFTRFRPRLLLVKAQRKTNAFGYTDRQLVEMIRSCGYSAFMMLQINNEELGKECVYFGDYDAGNEYRATKQDEHYVFVDNGLSRYFERAFIPNANAA